MSFSERGSSKSSRMASRRRHVQRSAFPLGGVGEAGSDIVTAQLGELLQELILGRAAGQILEYITNRDPRASNTRLSKPHRRFNRDPIKALHQTKPTPVELGGQSHRTPSVGPERTLPARVLLGSQRAQ